MSDKSPFEQIVEVLIRHGVEFIVIGGQAEYLHGGARVTFDVDLCYRRSAANLERLAAALRELGPTLRNAPADLPFVIDAQSLSLGDVFTFDTPSIPLDIMGTVEPIGGYEALLESAEVYRMGEMEVKAIGLDDLIRVKEHLGRSKDRDSLFQLRAIKQVRAAPKE